MVLDGSSYKYVPNKLTIKPGDIVRFHSKTGDGYGGQSHPDSIPANVPAPIKALAIAPPEKGGAASPASR